MAATRDLVEVVELVQRTRARRVRAQRAFSQRALFAGALALGFIGMLAAGLAIFAQPLFSFVTFSLPQPAELESMFGPQGALLQPTKFYDRTGLSVVLELQPLSTPRSFVDATANQDLANAFVASQDPQFWIRPASNLLDTGAPQGIAEKLVAALLLGDEPDGWIRNLRVRVLTNDVLTRFSREQVLGWALNSAYFGHWAFGVESAAQLYFAKPASELTLAEAALLAAVAQAPALNPVDAPELAIEYQRLVLAAMREQGMITDLEFLSAYEQPLTFAPQAVEQARSGFLQAVLAQLEAELGSARVQRGGLNVTTTLDLQVQQDLENLVPAGARAVVLDPINGRVLAAAGDVLADGEVDAATFTPFTYLGAFARGEMPANMVWAPGPTTLRAALANDVRALESNLEVESIAIREAFGLDDEVDLLQLAHAYGALSQNGLMNGAEPSFILFATNARNELELDLTHTEFQAVVAPELAFLVSDALRDASVREGELGSLLRTLGRSAAVQPGETAGQWMIGYSTQRVVALWSETGSDPALWASLFTAAHEQVPANEWQTPANLSSVIVCAASGMLPDEDCPALRREWFIPGSEPTTSDSLFQRIGINTVNNTLATVFTPEEFLEERVFMNIPPEAAAWARAEGIDQPPRNYDTVSAFSGQSGLVSIARPTTFSEVSGIVEIFSVLGAGTENFDIQVGQGLRPSEWTLLAEGEARPGTRRLAAWDTAGLEGVWAIQLQAWDESGNLSRAYAIVTVNP